MAHYEPIYTRNINEADEYCTDRILRGYCGAWFSGITGTKVDSLDCDLIDGLAKLHPNWQIVEADGQKKNGLRLLRRLSQSSHLSQRLRLVL